jgi:hypothetical protein
MALLKGKLGSEFIYLKIMPFFWLNRLLFASLSYNKFLI